LETYPPGGCLPILTFNPLRNHSMNAKQTTAIANVVKLIERPALRSLAQAMLTELLQIDAEVGEAFAPEERAELVEMIDRFEDTCLRLTRRCRRMT
jgi:hypothetical protein